jgi:hypothetical protein
VPNAPEATALIPDTTADNREFRELLGLIASLYQRDAVELAVDTVEVPTSDPIPTTNVHGQHLIEAARADFAFRSDGDKRLTLKQRQKTLALKVRSREAGSYEIQELTRRLRLAQGLDVYRIRSELLDDEKDDFGGPPNPMGDDTIFLNMRSTLEIMTFLSKGVCVPAKHVDSGEAPSVRDESGRPFDWTQVTAGLFVVHSGRKRPGEAEVAVRYRDHWFWVKRNDPVSRATLTTMELLISLQESDEKEAGPLLTLPVGG